MLNGAGKTAILAGVGALHAREQVEATAERLGAPVIKTLSGKAVLPDDSPYTTGGLGLLGTGPSEDLVGDIDALLMLGTNFPYSKYLPSPETKTVQIEADPTRAGLRIRTVAPVVGDVKESLEALLPLLSRKEDRSHLKKYQDAMATWRKNMRALENAERKPIAPQYPVAVLNELCTEDAIMTCDSGTIATWAARHWHIRGERQFFLSGNLATMAPGMPYAIGMQHAFPGRQVVAYVGDGGFAMLMAEFLTAVRHHLPIKVVINNNNAYGQILWEQIVLGYPEHMVRHAPPEANFANWATSCGGFGAKVTDPGDVKDAIAAALAHSGPALVDIDVDPNEPPLPGHIKYEQAKKFTEAFLKGQPHKLTTATTLFKDKIQQLKA